MVKIRITVLIPKGNSFVSPAIGVRMKKPDAGIANDFLHRSVLQNTTIYT